MMLRKCFNSMFEPLSMKKPLTQKLPQKLKMMQPIFVSQLLFIQKETKKMIILGFHITLNNGKWRKIIGFKGNEYLKCFYE